ncbi:sigma-54 dependent transcriptional regulator [Photobacterium sp. 2_MG-2023]|uniref:Sigma-54-dependent Fis family transcriptional regulator n=1 Tax=Photobacterium arenosum TaxID=2774143 RepID=A0ABR9BPC9_9GAMM|nr:MULTISPECIES: sigma-54 dependent transcriptional regulator [Photobacterium]MBD8513442.1 sigma-54-dependent Fis family transcriptional regulator [Photobacterium arenosum]MDO6582211.1 sigma-54 dependent transcriptional regulator [Photobacterium sp. 2_MG-2023]
MKPPVIFIDDEKTIRDSLGQTLELEDYQVQLFSSARQALSVFDNQFPGVIITDINMPGMDGMTFLQQALAIDAELPVIMLTGHGDISTAVDAMRIGAYDFLEKPFSTEHLLDVVKRACDKRELVLENRELKRELASQSSPGPRILGNSLAIKQLRRSLYQLQADESTILLEGEEGTGKRMVAQFIHDHSPRQHLPLISLKCQDLTEQQFEELCFGHASYAGKWSDATGSTLYLENIDQLAAASQQRLLYQLTQQDQLAVNSNHNKTRVIVSSSRSLDALTSQGQFSRELFQHLKQCALSLPPLRERQEDIELLFQNFIRTAASRYNIEAPVLNAEQKSKLLAYDWPGNVRELRSVSERLVLLGSHFDQHQTLDLDAPLPSLSERVHQFEFTLISDALRRHNGRLKEVQSELALARKTLYDKMKKHGLDKQDFKE